MKLRYKFEDSKGLGDFGEEVARLYLESKGCEILARNYKFMRREIDIIARDGEYIVFIEVKTRTSSYVTAAEQVDLKKQGRIIYAAQGWLLENNTGLQPRFDVVEVYIMAGRNYVRRIENAFILTEKNRGRL